MDNTLVDLFAKSFDFMLFALPIVIPIFLIWRIILNFTDYKRQNYWNSLEYILLEIIPPAEVKKTPAAMELFLVSLHQTSGESTWIKKYILGKTRAWFSLEIVSLGGEVHFYIWTRVGFRRFIESQIFAQYPNIEIKESEDYAQIFDFDPAVNDVWGAEFMLKEPDPFPIKTYVDYLLDMEDKEESQVDPITPMLELMSSLNPGEYMWFQFIIRAHKTEDKHPEKWFGKTDAWKDSAKVEVEKIRAESLSRMDPKSGENIVVTTSNQTEGQRKRIGALERSVSKLAFDVGIRALYLADHDNFDEINRPILLASMKQFNSNDLNSFEVGHITDFDYPWQDFKDIRLNKLKYEILEMYKDRKYFFTNTPGLIFEKARKSIVLNTEELATIFHFPGKVSEAPSLRRVESRKVGPPPNLPI